MSATPGPWYALSGPNNSVIIATTTGPDWPKHQIAQVWNPADGPVITSAVNAHEALSDLAHRIVEAFEHGGDWAVVDAPLATAARAALKLAEGKP